MGMVIKNNIDSVRTYNIYNKNTIALSSSMYKVSSGQRINSAADGPSDLAISERMRGQISSNEQAGRNVQAGINMVRTAEGALSNIVDILNAMRERAVNAANDSNTSAERGYLQAELDALAEQIEQNSQVTYNGHALLSGAFAGSGSGLTIQYGGQAGLNLEITIGSMTPSALGLTGLSFATGSDARVAIGTIDSVIGNVLQLRTTLGSFESRLGFTADNIATENENLTASESAIRDLDMAKGITDFMKYNVLTQASEFMLAQAGQNAYSVLNLLQQ